MIAPHCLAVSSNGRKMISAYSRLPSSTPGTIDLKRSIDARVTMLIQHSFMNMSRAAKRTRQHTHCAGIGALA
jgi:hypothetical protein